MLNTAYERIINPDTKEETLIPPNPYLWITQARESIYFQDGKFYRGEGEEPISWQDVPEWFWEIARNSYPPEVLIKKYGLKFPEERELTDEEINRNAVEAEAKTWVCDRAGCGKEIPLRQKGVHMALHAGADKRKAKKEPALV